MRSCRLTDLYTQAEMADETELLWQFLPEEGAEDSLFPVKELDAAALARLLCADRSTTVLRALDDFATGEQRRHIDALKADFDPTRIAVICDQVLVDGYHHVAAAAELGRDVLAMDIAVPLDQYDPGGP